MNLTQPFGDLAPSQPVASPRPITLSIHAMGGQGGGVLIDWLIAVAGVHGFAVQATSVAGVAQRTGATVYYVEMLAPPAEGWLGRKPVLAMMPGPGEVDVVIGAELMEAGRAIQRGLVTPGRTTLIASAHRALAVSEKSVPGDGIADGGKVYEAAAASAKRFIAFDMAEIADNSGSVISAVLLGALAGSGALPFSRESYEAAVRHGGVGVEASLHAFSLGFKTSVAQSAAGGAPPRAKAAVGGKKLPELTPAGIPAFDALVAHAREAFPMAVHGMVAAGLRRTFDFQDADYAGEYLRRLGTIASLDSAAQGYRLTEASAKHIARAMAYDDVFRVAELKTRASRFLRVRGEVAARDGDVLGTTEFMHPRLDEVAGALPARLGLWLETSAWAQKLARPLIDRPRRVQTGTIRWFLPLYAIAGMKTTRRRTLRHQREQTHLNAWLAKVAAAAPRDYALAVELIENRRLIKGYSDTHARGSAKFDKVMAAADKLANRPDAADWVRRLRVAALADEDGVALGDALKTVESFVND